MKWRMEENLVMKWEVEENRMMAWRLRTIDEIENEDEAGVEREKLQ